MHAWPALGIMIRVHAMPGMCQPLSNACALRNTVVCCAEPAAIAEIVLARLQQTGNGVKGDAAPEYLSKGVVSALPKSLLPRNTVSLLHL